MKFIQYCRSCGSNACTAAPAVLAPFMTERMFGMKPWTTRSLYGLPNQINYFPCVSLTCESCEFVGVNILLDDEEMSRLYRGYRDEEYNKMRSFYEPTYENSVFSTRHVYVDEVSQPFIEEHISNVETLIDFGGYDGLNTPKIGTQRYVYDVCGADSEIPIAGTLFDCDLITCMHVLEHVPDPNKIIGEMRGYARYYYFEVPDESNATNKEFWHEHINRFTMASFFTFTFEAL